MKNIVRGTIVPPVQWASLNIDSAADATETKYIIIISPSHVVYSLYRKSVLAYFIE